ncbi:MAG TPA: FAD-binding protein [Gemmatimonadales bacterium]|nr:FAD-binding protein [Gemmatimonadales bacterium]
MLLKYRVPRSGPSWDADSKRYINPKPQPALQDAQRAMGIVRLHAAEWHIDPHQVGVLGFSAGGHLVAAISNQYQQRLYPIADVANSQSCRPDFAVALYPGHLWMPARGQYGFNPDIHVWAAAHQRSDHGMAPTRREVAEDHRDNSGMNHSLSRREFVSVAATGAATMLGLEVQNPVLHGAPRLDGQLLVDSASRAAIAIDYSNVYHRIPAAVLQPRSVQDVLRIVQYANERSLKVAIKGDGHSQYGQTQAARGIVIDSRTLRAVQPLTEASIDVQPGAFWTDVAGATLGRHVTPRVYPATCMMLTVGGTLSVGGIGNTSHRYGAQIDNVLELDVVTGDGRLITCSAAHESELFNLVLGGVGQCGIIVRARVPLVPAPSEALIQELHYDDLDAYLGDQIRIAQEGRYDHLRGSAYRKDGKWTFSADVGKYFSAPNLPDMAGLRRGLQFTSAGTPRRMPYALNLFQYVTPQPSVFDAKRAYITAFVPASTAKEFVSTIMALSPEERALNRAGGTERFSLYALNTARFTRPMLRLPQAEQVFVVWLFRTVPANDASALARVQQSNRELLARMTALGGKRYSPYSGVMSAREWAAHFGPDVWQRLAAAKHRYDPNNVLSPGPAMFAATAD